MARSETHAWVGAGVGCLAYCHEQQKLGKECDLWEALGAALLGALLGILPDSLEPAHSPRHRSLLHSFTVLGLGFPTTQAVVTSQALTPENAKWLKIAWAAYASHLVVDAFSPSGLPVLTT